MSRSHQPTLLDTVRGAGDGAAAGSVFGTTQGSSGAVLREARAAQRDAETAQVRLLVATVEWVAMHSADRVTTASGGRDAFRPVVPLAGTGAPLVEDLAVDELIAVLGMSPGTGRAHVAAAVELRYRLPRLYDAVVARKVVVWRARRIAETTLHQTREVASYVDRHVTPVASSIGTARLDALVEEAVWRTDPDTAERIAHEAEHELDDRRHVSIDRDRVTYSGTVEVTAELDMLDAYDLDDALTRRAGSYAALGSTAPLGARRAAALGDLARADLTLDLDTALNTPDTSTRPGPERRTGDQTPAATGTTAAVPAEPAAPDAPTDDATDDPTGPAETVASGTGAAGVEALTRRASGRRGINLYLHLTLDQLTATATSTTGSTTGSATGSATGDDGSGARIGRAEHLRGPVPAELIRDWCGRPTTDLRVVPVIDLADHVHVDAYEIPDRITERIALRDHHCVFPHCTRPARRLSPDQHAADCDHIRPHSPARDPGGVTCTCNLAPLCRRHHRLKTHTGWTYSPLSPGTYVWTSPHGHHWIRDHHGTHTIEPTQPGRPPGTDPPHEPEPDRPPDPHAT